MMISARQQRSFRIFALLAVALPGITACGGPDEQELIISAKRYMEEKNYSAAALELKNVIAENADNAEARYLFGKIQLTLGDARNAEIQMRRALNAGWDEAAVQRSLAEALFRQRKFQQVIDDIPVEDSYPQAVRADLLGMRAAAEQALGNRDSAADTLKAARSTSANAYWVLLSSIIVLVDDGNSQAARETLAEALRIYPESQELWMLKARFAEQGKDASSVRADLQKVVDLDPSRNITLWGRQARLALSRLSLVEQDYTNARKMIEPILAASPTDPLANYQAGLIAFRQGLYDQTQDRLLKALKVAPEHIQSLLLFGTLNYIRNDYQQAAHYLEKAVATQPGSAAVQILLGKTYLMLGQYEEAENRFKLASTMQGDQPELMALLGVARVRGGNVQAGLENLEDAAAQAPSDTGVRNELARAYMTAGDTRRAIEVLEAGLQQDDDENKTDVLLLLAYLRANEFDKAIDLANELSGRLPDKGFADMALAIASEGKKDYATARRLYGEVLRDNPDDILALLGLARLDIRDGDPQAARERYQAVLALQPGQSEALISLVFLLDRQGEVEEAVDLLEKARKSGSELLEPRLLLSSFYLRRGDAAAALEYAREAHNITPGDRRVLLALGKAQLGAGEGAGAVATLQQLVDLVPEFAESHYYLGLSKASVGDVQGARSALQKNLELNPRHIQAKLVLGNLELNTGNTAKAQQIAGELQQTDPESAAGYLLEGDVMMSREQPEKAVSAYELAMSRTGSSQVVVRIFKAHRMAGDKAAGYDALLEWLEKNPDDFAVRFSLASAYVADGRKDDAKSHLGTILENEPDNALALNDLAWLKYEGGESGALEMAERAHSLAPDNAAIQDTYGWLLVQSGRLEQGLLALEQAAKKAPGIYDIRYHLAVALAKVGEKNRAKRELEAILETGTAFSEETRAKALLDELSL